MNKNRGCPITGEECPDCSPDYGCMDHDCELWAEREEFNEALIGCL